MFWRSTIRMVLLFSGVVYIGACSSAEDKGRFIVAQASPPQNTIAPSPSPAPSIATTVKQADANFVSPEPAKLYLQMSEEEQYEFVEQRARHISRMIGSG